MKIATTAEVNNFIGQNSPVAIGVSGGKDSCAVAFAITDYLKSVSYRGEIVLIHSDLGSVEWKDSLPTCERLAKALKLELIIVKRRAGGMMDRWRARWNNNRFRYENLLCVQLILPWSTPSMRFCTSELKTAVIASDLTSRFPGKTILSVSGIRREESDSRAKKPVLKHQPKLQRVSTGTSGNDWHPIIEWSLADVLALLKKKNFRLHEAYTLYGSSRVSCAFCIMSSQSDLAASARCSGNHGIYREMVALEVESGFSFQSNQWLGDVAPGLLDPETRTRLEKAKAVFAERKKIESAIPKHLLYTAGWPTCVPTCDEAVLLSRVRRSVADLMNFQIKYSAPETIIARYEELMALKDQKRSTKGRI